MTVVLGMLEKSNGCFIRLRDEGLISSQLGLGDFIFSLINKTFSRFFDLDRVCLFVCVIV